METARGMEYVIGTRGSKLALAQAEIVRERLREAYPECGFRIQVISTRGDQVQDRPLDQIGGKGLFVRGIEEQLLDGKIHLGVHSMKDMPAECAPGLIFTKPWAREDPRDVLVLREKESLSQLAPGAVIGTGSKRRAVQLKLLRPDVRTVGIRGNVDTRLRKMEDQKLDGLVLAAAGLKRLGLEDIITQYLEPEELVPAPAQGILAIEIREDDPRLREMLDALCDEDTVTEAMAEREFLKHVGGDCHKPVGALCRRLGKEQWELLAFFDSMAQGTVTRDESQAVLEHSPSEMVTRVTGPDPLTLAIAAASRLYGGRKGTVCLTGGGPGNPGLISVSGLNAIRQADCIVYDRLISRELLLEARPDCELIFAGKAKGSHSMEQEEINRLLIQKAGQWKKIVRLKGGDPYVFGRGGEEGLALSQAKVPFQVIPGISSCIAGPGLAGIPVTHRGLSGGFYVVTAHNQKDILANIDFKAMARGKDTCIFLMGLSRLGEIVSHLLEAGMNPDTEAAVISMAGTASQKVCVSDLSHLEQKARKAGLISPAVIVVGEVVRLREKLGFSGQVFTREGGKPGRSCGDKGRGKEGSRRYLLPKIDAELSPIASLLRRAGHEVVELQVGRIVPCDVIFTEKMFAGSAWLVFTSKNGVEMFWRNFLSSGLDVRSLVSCRIAAVGERTAGFLREKGLWADLVPEAANAQALGEALREKVTMEDRILYMKAENSSRDLKEVLGGICSFEEITVYRNEEVPAFVPNSGEVSWYAGVILTCSSSARRLFHALGAEASKWRGEACFYSIGPKTTCCLKNLGAAHIFQAEEASSQGLVSLLL